MNSTAQSWMHSRTVCRVLIASFVFTTIVFTFLIPGKNAHNLLPTFRTPSIGPKVAVIFDNRADSRLVPVILHFSSILGADWPILLFTIPTFKAVSKAFHRKIEDGSIQLRDLPSTVFEKHTDVSAFMTRPWLWEQLMPAKHVLIFQLDSIICSNSHFEIDDYLQYDFIGAPIQDVSGWGLGFNGGLSLRNLDKTLHIVRNNNWTAELKDSKEKGLDGVPISPTGTNDINVIFPGHDNSPRIQYEDQWFFKKFMEFPGANLPPLNVSKTFSVESIPYDTPFGYHKPSYGTPQEREHLDTYCPEYTLATSQSIIDA